MSTNHDVLVSTQWAEDHLNDSDVRFVEVDVDTSAYESGHVPGAVGWNWQTQLQHQVRRDIVSKHDFEILLRKSGVADSNSRIVLYGDNNNWFAAYAYWLLKYFGHDAVQIVDGGRKKWIAEGRPLTTDVPNHSETNYAVTRTNANLRAHHADVLRHLDNPDGVLVDVRSPDEFTGKVLAPPGLNETAQRGGHIPGAANIPWSQAVREDGTFKSTSELKELYEGNGIRPGTDVITYCRIGERSSHSWFVLKELLHYDNVRNYDGSWTEWGNLIGAPIDKN
ncbi:MAG: sulfurtransferase [Rhodothermia bacterium]|nr:sulfurtransferase [Rhodothermia bacterium]